MTNLILNGTKEKLSIAYLYAVTAKLNYGISKADKDFDNEGIDYSIINKIVGEKRTVAQSPADIINIQLKCVSSSSRSMFQDSIDKIKYKLSKPINPIGNHYLVILQVLDEDCCDQWCEINEEELVLRKCAYFLKIDQPVSAGFIEIPKENLFNSVNLPNLFLQVINKEDFY